MHLDLSKSTGYPDGLYVDSENNLYVCFWEGSRVDVFSGKKKIKVYDDFIMPNATCCCLAIHTNKIEIFTTLCGETTPRHAGVFRKYISNIS